MAEKEKRETAGLEGLWPHLFNIYPAPWGF